MTSRGIKRAVEAMRRYLGVVDRAPVAVQQRFYRAAHRRVDAVATHHGMTPELAWEQIEKEARRRGIILGQPGKDF